ncbi:MAG: hypothetical protein IKE78_05880 [Erysipelotrichaceae bacterium]|nr:hypothetical protein [Erysipelotrichaceae bacterium]MBR2827015.1 hypothetical protein [Erysipelotrichaceae bacterium]
MKILLSVLLLGSVMTGCKKDPAEEPAVPEPESESQEAIEVEKDLCLYINDRKLPVTWEDNPSVSELKNIVSNEKLTVEMSMYGGFEQVGDLGSSITRNDRQTTTSSGDIVLYSGSSIVIFYGSNSWSYTRLGHVDLNEEEMRQLLANGDVTVVLSIE